MEKDPVRVRTFWAFWRSSWWERMCRERGRTLYVCTCGGGLGGGITFVSPVSLTVVGPCIPINVIPTRPLQPSKVLPTPPLQPNPRQSTYLAALGL